MLIKENIFNTNSACLAQAMATCKNMAICNFYLNTWRQTNFQPNCNDKKSPTTGRLVGLRQV